jgi:peptide/nickel transport system substrate-binding protein
VATVAWGPISPANPAHNKAVDKQYPYDPQKAKDLLTKAGFPNGIKVTAAEINHPYYTKFAEALQEMLRKANINLDLSLVPATEINQALYTRKQYVAAVTAYAGNEDAGLMMEAKYKLGGAANASSVSVPGIEALLDQGAQETDQAKRATIYQQAEKLLMDGAYEVPIYFNGGLDVVANNVANVTRGYTTCVMGNFVDPPPYIIKK